MTRKAGVVVIQLQAGTAELIRDLDSSEARVKRWGSSGGEAMRAFGGHTQASMASASAAIRTMEGNLTHNVRAVERFLAQTLGLGPALQAAFPIFGAVALLGIIGQLGEKTYEFFKDIRTYPERMMVAFRELNAPLRLANDELQVTNDRLANDIAKLEGRRQNTLKLALDEARQAADKLAASLDKDLDALHKLLEEQKIGFWKSLISGKSETKDIQEEIFGKSGVGGFRERISIINEEGNTKIRQATDLQSKQNAQTELATKLTKAYADEIAKVNQMIAERERLAKGTGPQRVQFPSGAVAYTQGTPPRDEADAIHMLEAVRRNLQLEQAGIGLHVENTELIEKKEKLTADRANERLDKPFEDRRKLLEAELKGAQLRRDAAGAATQDEKLYAEAEANALKIIEEVNKAMERQHTQLTAQEKSFIKNIELQIVRTNADEKWRAKLAQSTAEIRDQVRGQELLTAAIGKGYEAMRKATVETQIATRVGAENFNDQSWRLTHLTDIEKLRALYTQEYDARHNEEAARATEKLTDEIKLENRLAQVQIQGAEAIQLATLQVRLAKLKEDGATREQIKAEEDLFVARRANQSAADVAKINERIAATKRLTAAIVEGAEAERRAALQNKLADQERAGGTLAPGLLGVTREAIAEAAQEQADHEKKVTEEALRTGLAYQNQLENLQQEISILEQMKAEGKDSLAVEISLRNLRNEQIRILAEQQLQMRRASDGMRAFFIEMTADGKSAAQQTYEAFHEAFDRITSELAKLVTGQKFSFGKMFKELGGHIVENNIKSLAQKGLGALAKHIPGVGGILGQGKPDGTQKNPIWVKNADAVSKAAGSIPGLFGSGDKGGGIFSILGSLASGFIPHATGGDVSPGSAYIVGEHGPEPFFPNTPGSIMSNAAARKTFGGGLTVYYAIDARGTDPVLTEQRTRAAILAAHNSAVGTGIQVRSDQLRRIPQKLGVPM